jgi:glucosamine-6-phosphate deaminase
MKIIIKKTYEDLSRAAVEIIKEAIQAKPNLVLGLASGGTPQSCYQKLCRLHKEERLDFSQVTCFSLDEYLELPFNNPNSYYYFYCENLLNHINIQFRNIHFPNGLTENPTEFSSEYEKQIKEAGGIDLQLLGVGRDGHIGFNEPGTPLHTRTHLAKLTDQTIEDNARFFKIKENVPKFVITMGPQTVLEAKKIVLLASGENKAEATAKFIEGPITPQITASILQKHPNTTVILDEKAASKLKRKY